MPPALIRVTPSVRTQLHVYRVVVLVDGDLLLCEVRCGPQSHANTHAVARHGER